MDKAMAIRGLYMRPMDKIPHAYAFRNGESRTRLPHRERNLHYGPIAPRDRLEKERRLQDQSGDLGLGQSHLGVQPQGWAVVNKLSKTKHEDPACFCWWLLFLRGPDCTSMHPYLSETNLLLLYIRNSYREPSSLLPYGT